MLLFYQTTIIMEIKFYEKNKLIAVSNSLPKDSSERERHIMAMVYMVDDKYDSYTIDRERVTVNKIDHLKRMAYANNIDLNLKSKLNPLWKNGHFYSVVGSNVEKAYDKLSGMELTCPVCGKKMKIDWFGIFHACYNQDTEKQFTLDYDLYELYHLRKANEQFWKEINQLYV